MTPPPRPPLARRLAGVAAGLFALWQVAFLVAANCMNFVPTRTADPEDAPYKPVERGTFTTVEPVQRAADAAGAVLDAYGEATGQEQLWSLFAPGFPPHSLFTAVELQFPDGSTAEVRSEYEPSDYDDPPVRAPLLSNRRYNFEVQFTPAVLHHTADALADPAHARGIRATTFGYFRHAQPVVLAWMRYRAAGYLEQHPDKGPPERVVFLARYVPTPVPGAPRASAREARVRPLARWTPGRDAPADALPLEVYDVATTRWVTLVKGGGER